MANPIPNGNGAQIMLLLSDGTIMVQGGSNEASKLWYQLKPDSTGHYLNGTWSQLASMSLERLFFPTEVLPSGKVMVMGGEYSGPNSTQNVPNTGEIYDPVTNTWSNTANFPKNEFGDDPLETLPDGRVLGGYILGPQTYIYDPKLNTWSPTGTKLRNDASDEESWVKLPDGSILSYDIFASDQSGVGHAQRFVPSTGTWVDAGTLPFTLSSSSLGFELGPSFLLPDGRAFYFGANGKTVYYTPSTNTWTAGPSVPNGLGCTDDPGAMLPNGDVLITASPTDPLFSPPTTVFEFDPVAGTYTDVTPSNFALDQINPFQTNMLVLPTGQIMMTNNSRQLEIYTPTGSPKDAWRPTISTISVAGNTATLSGTQLNGISEGANFGDDNQMASNYPIVRLSDAAGNNFYARTFNWSSTGVATGSTPVSVQFTAPAGHEGGAFGLTVIANGIPSATVPVNLGQFSISNVSQFEGDSGLTDFVFTVTAPASVNRIAVAYSTADGSATAGKNDYLPTSGILTFAPGETSKQITVQVVGNTTVEPDETFFVSLTDPVVPGVFRGSAVGTILNDDLDLSINDASIVEGNSGTRNMVFTVLAQGFVHQNVTVDYATNDVTTTAGLDYLPIGGQLVFPPQGGVATVTVPIIGDTLSEQNEVFDVTLSNAVAGHIIKGIGSGTIIDDDRPPGLYVNDVQVKATASGELDAVFTVALDTASGQNVSVQYATADGGAVAGTNYAPTSGILTFAPGTTTQFVTVPVMTSSTYAPNEQFYLNLSNPVHAPLATPRGVATIVFATAPSGETIVDNGDPNYSQTPGWVNLTNTAAYQLDFDYHTPGNGSDAATWSFPDAPPGTYQIYARWVPFSNRATNAPFTIIDGSTSLGTVSVNEQLAPTGDLSNGVIWQSLGTFTTSKGMLAVRLNDNANGYVIADAIRVVAGGIAAKAPEMDVSGGGLSILDRMIAPTLTGPEFDNATDFGDVAATTNSATHTFTITNTGDADLHLTGAPRVTISGVDAQDFTILTQPASTIGPGATSTFQVMFHPGDVGLRQAVISIANDDASEHPYTFDVQGTGTDAGPMQLVLDDSMVGYTQTGSWVSSANSHADQGEMRSDGGGAGNDHATWSFTGLAPGNYTVYATWVPFINRATNAPFTIADGSATQTTVSVNQQQEPSGLAAAGTMWKSLASLQLSTGALSITLSNQANGFVIADAVYVVRNDPPAAPVVVPIAPPSNPPGNPPASNFAHNGALPQDVNGDGHVSSLDALLVIDHLLDAGITNNAAPNATAQAVTATTSGGAATSNSYLDVNGDGIVSPIDGLLVIDYLDNQTSQTNAASAAVASPSVPAALPASSAANSPAINSAVSSPAALAAAAVDQAIGQLSGTQPFAASPVDAGPPPIPLSSPVNAGPPPAVASPTVAATGLLTPASVRTFFGASDQTSGGTSVVDPLDD